MKRILIVNNNLCIGGVQKALISLLWNIRSDVDVTLLLFHNGGELVQELPPDIKVITAESAYRYLGMPGSHAKGLKDKLGRSFYAAVSRVFGRSCAVGLMGLGQKKLTGYDIAISYLHNGADKAFYGGCNEFVLKHVQAKKKIAFLHCDYSLCGAQTARNEAQYAKFDRIAACSGGCAAAFIAANPHLEDKVRVVYNCHRFKRIRELAAEVAVQLPKDRLNVVTVARLGKEKGVERAVQAIADLGPMRDKLHYYIIGDGLLRSQIEALIEKEGLQGHVTLCGQLHNPYGYLQAADLLLIPSYSEAAPLVIGEAACLGTPVLSTKTSSAEELLTETGFGLVCENSVAGLTAALREWKNTMPAPQQQISNDEALAGFYRCIKE
jgi:glycosyltransferase involved in cell wall biosynthesis